MGHNWEGTAELALYDQYKNRLTTWFPASTEYVCTEADHRAVVFYVGVRDFDYFELLESSFSLVAGSRLVVNPPPGEGQPGAAGRADR